MAGRLRDGYRRGETGRDGDRHTDGQGVRERREMRQTNRDRQTKGGEMEKETEEESLIHGGKQTDRQTSTRSWKKENREIGIDRPACRQ